MIVTKEDARKFIDSMDLHHSFEFEDSQIKNNRYVRWAFTRIIHTNNDEYTIYSWWSGGNDMTIAHLNKENTANLVWKKRADINKKIKNIQNIMMKL